MPFQKITFQTAHLAGGLFHAAHLLKMEQPLILLNVKIAEGIRQWWYGQGFWQKFWRRVGWQ